MPIRSLLFIILNLLFSFAVFANDFSNAQKLFIEKQYTKSIPFLIRASQTGNSKAQVLLGYIYENGLGIAKNYETAFYWYNKAVKQNNIFAQGMLGICYFHGDGVEQDYTLAESW